MRKSTQYVNNKDFLSNYIEWKKDILMAEASDKEYPVMPRYLGECILKIANHLAYKANFINYSYRDEMIGDAIENCSRVLHKFNPERSSNIFAYTTQICYNAFLRRIIAEKKQTTLKGKLIQEIPIEDLFDINPDDEETLEFRNMYIEFLTNNNFLSETKTESKQRQKHTNPDPLEKFVDD